MTKIKDRYSNNPHYCVRYGFALYNLHREDEALEWFKKAQEKGLEEIDETPGTYHPKSVAKWILFSERWAPRRIEKNAFEKQCRANKKQPTATENNFVDFDFDGFWDDAPYSLEKYVGQPPTDALIRQTEKQLGYRLPESYKTLIKRHNGGLLRKNCFAPPSTRLGTQQIQYFKHLRC
ncbi:MAG: SMI1/KNR4 family protein [Saezia sp.]